MTNEEIMRKVYKDSGKKELDKMCSKYALEIENLTGDGDIEEFFQNDVINIQYVVDGTKNYTGALLCVSHVGPSVWIDTLDKKIKGSWGNTTSTKHFRSSDGLDDYCRELWYKL